MSCPECGESELEESRSGRPLLLWLLPGAVYVAFYLLIVAVLGRITEDVTPFVVGIAVYSGVLVSAYGSWADEFARSGFVRCPECGWFRGGPKRAARFAAGLRSVRIVRGAIIVLALYFAGLSVVQVVQGGWVLSTGLEFVAILGILPTVNSVRDIYRPD